MQNGLGGDFGKKIKSRPLFIGIIVCRGTIGVSQTKILSCQTILSFFFFIFYLFIYFWGGDTLVGYPGTLDLSDAAAVNVQFETKEL